MYLNGIAVSIYIENAAYRNLYRSSVRNQFDVSGILWLSELDRGKDTAQFFRIKGFQQIVGCLDIVAFHSIGITACNEDQSGSVFCIAQFSGCIHTGHGVHVNVHNDQVIKAWRIFCEKGLCTGIQTDVCGCVTGFIVRRDNRFYLPQIFFWIIKDCNIQKEYLLINCEAVIWCRAEWQSGLRMSTLQYSLYFRLFGKIIQGLL